jgi:hypothetical protein
VGILNPFYGIKFTEERRKNISLSKKGKKYHCMPHTDETKRKMSEAHRGRCTNTGRTHFKKGQIPHNKKEWIKKECPICKKAFFITPSISARRTHCSFQCRNIAMADGRGKRENCYNWRGGISFEPYPYDFTNELRELIRKRDNYKCQICGCPQEECLRKLSVHHIDYDKKNLNPDNLISLCIKCHIKTNYNREHYIVLFNERVKHYG